MVDGRRVDSPDIIIAVCDAKVGTCQNRPQLKIGAPSKKVIGIKLGKTEIRRGVEVGKVVLRTAISIKTSVAKNAGWTGRVYLHLESYPFGILREGALATRHDENNVDNNDNNDKDVILVDSR